ncbi:prolyl oligopeptidase family serine peptidase [Rothia sp. LK2588]|uniref:prolyl oligopeptidase family protein n=1 Tax=Rothia sp. LK2588 TaxID=3114369 RepID=UPI0034CF1C58
MLKPMSHLTSPDGAAGNSSAAVLPHRNHPEHDPFAYLEELNDETLEWARQRTDKTLSIFSGSRFHRHLAESNEIMASKDKLVVGTRRGEYVYVFYADGEHPRGLWRRTPKADYDEWRGPETEPEWELLLDIGALGREEGQPWVFGGMKICRDGYDRALVTLRPGGSDANVIREFDLVTREFVPDGFVKPLSKGDARWLNRNTVLLAHDFGDATTRAGYPSTVRLWQRGTRIEDARVLLAGEKTDTRVGGHNFNLPGFEKTMVYRTINFRNTELYDMDRTTHEITRFRVPRSADCAAVRDWLTVHLREPWEVAGQRFASGSLLALPYEAAKEQADDSELRADQVRVIFEPTPASSLLSYAGVKDGIYFTVLDNVRTRLYFAEDTAEGWKISDLNPDVGEFNTIRVQPINAEARNSVNMVVSGFLTPPTLYKGSFTGGFAGENFGVEKLRSTPDRFDTAGLEVRQRWVTSADGTRVPYFVVGLTAALDGEKTAPTLLSAYGGFQVSQTPSYSSLNGKGLLEKGYVYALANIRGGGEFGPAWHQAALRENRARTFEDFAAVARDLVDAGITTVPQLAAMGGSNGGLLVGNMYTHYPHLFGALVCQVPLLDMKRYSHLLAGASWVAEYGDPDTDDWEFLGEFSPYHCVNPDDLHPTLLLTTSTRDDRVHPAHARKFMALLESLGKPVHYFENIEGGHAGAADVHQRAAMHAMIFTYLDNAILP